MDSAIDLYYRRLSAATQTGHLVEFESAILRDLAWFNADGCLELLG
jgi:hypothetical protein